MSKGSEEHIGKLTRLRRRRDNNPGCLTVGDLKNLTTKDGVYIDADQLTKRQSGMEGGQVTPLKKRLGMEPG